MKTIIFLCAITAVICVSCAKVDTPPTKADKNISKDEAIGMARQVLQGQVTVPAEANAVVSEEGGKLIVTFLEPGQEESSSGRFYARVSLDNSAGRVIGEIEHSK